MVRYRQELIRQSNYLLLQLAGLRIEQEKWRDAPVVRGPGGKFASPQGLSDEEKRNAEKKGLLERVKDGGKEAVKDITEGTKDFAASLKALLYAIPGNINALIQAIAEKLFGKNKDDEFQQELAKEFSKPINLPPDKSLKDLDQDIRDAFQDAEEATDKEKAAKAVKKAFAVSAQFTGKVLLGALQDVTGSKDSPNYQYGKKFAVEDIQQGREKMLSEDSGWFEKRVGAAQYMYGGFNNGVVETKAFASRWLLPLAIPASSGQSLAIAVAETTIPDIAAITIDKELEKRGVDGKTRFLTSLAVGIGGSIAAGVAVNKISTKVLSSVERGTAAGTFKEILFSTPEAASRTKAKMIGEAVAGSKTFVADIQKKITDVIDNVVSEIKEIDRQPKAFIDRSQRLMNSILEDVDNIDLNDIAVGNTEAIDALAYKLHAKKTMFGWSVEYLKPRGHKKIEATLINKIDEITESISKIDVDNEIVDSAKQAIENFASGCKEAISKGAIVLSPKTLKYVKSQYPNYQRIYRLDYELDRHLDAVAEAWDKVYKNFGESTLQDTLETQIKKLKEIRASSSEKIKSMDGIIERFEKQLEEVKSGNLQPDIESGLPNIETPVNVFNESIEDAIEASEKYTRKLLKKASVKDLEIPATVIQEIESPGNGTYHIPINKDTPISLHIYDKEAKDIIGSSLSEGAIVKDVSFMTAGTYTEHGVKLSNVTQAERNAAAKKLKRTFNAVVSQAEEGTVFTCTVQGADSLVETRLQAYKAMGFASPVLGKGTMYGVVKNGRLMPAYNDGSLIQKI